MYINITNSATANNKGSSGGLVNYLEKENRLEHKNEPENWFNHQRQNIEPYEVRQAMDNNVAKLCQTDAKFFLINISPSQKELNYLDESYGKLTVKEQLKRYAEKVMDEYARNFKREGINYAKTHYGLVRLKTIAIIPTRIRRYIMAPNSVAKKKRASRCISRLLLVERMRPIKSS